MHFGSHLSKMRRSRHWSQEELAERAGLSQRHLSFLETGRSQPGERSLRKLTEALALKGWEHRALFQSLAPIGESGKERSHTNEFIGDIVERISVWPAYAFQPDGTLLSTNKALDRLLAIAAPGEDLWRVTAPASGPNIYDLVFHPRGLVRWLENPAKALPETLRRLRIEAAHDPAILPALNRIEAYPSAETWQSHGEIPPQVLIERYRIAERQLAIISVLSHLASSGELELDQLRIESFVPADQSSERLITELCS